jgi:hypothetical protein
VHNPDGGETFAGYFNYYERLPNIVPASAASAAVHRLPDHQQVDVFVRGSDNTLRHTFQTQSLYQGNRSSWSAWENLSGALSSAPTAVSWGNQNRIDVFVKGTDNGLWHRWWDGSTWSGWEGLGGKLTSDPVVTSWSAGRLDVFARGTDNQLWHRFFAGSWAGWESLGGILNSAPGGASWGPNRIDVFIQGSDHAVWHKWWDGVRWIGWESLHGAISQAPAASSGYPGPGRLEVYALGARNDLFHLSFFSDSGWSGWSAEGTYWNGGSWAYGPGVENPLNGGNPSGIVDVFEIGSDHTVWRTQQ